MQEKWKVLESRLKGMRSLKRYKYQYLGMNYSSDPDCGRVRFEYIFRNLQTVWINFTYYPQTKTQPDLLRVVLVSPFRLHELVLDDWVRKYSHRHNVNSFRQFAGEFAEQAAALVRLVDQTLSKPGLNAVLAGQSAVDIPSLSLNA